MEGVRGYILVCEADVWVAEGYCGFHCIGDHGGGDLFSAPRVGADARKWGCGSDVLSGRVHGGGGEWWGRVMVLRVILGQYFRFGYRSYGS